MCVYAQTLNFPEASIYLQINMDENKNAHWTTLEAIHFRICINLKCSLVVLPPWYWSLILLDADEISYQCKCIRT